MSSFLCKDLKSGSSPKTMSDMKKVHIALGIHAEYRQCCRLLSLFHWEKGGLLPKKKIKKDHMLARLIAYVESTSSKGKKKRSKSPARKSPVKKKPMTFFFVRRSSTTAEKHVIDLSSPKGKKKATKSAYTKPATPKKAKT